MLCPGEKGKAHCLGPPSRPLLQEALTTEAKLRARAAPAVSLLSPSLRILPDFQQRGVTLDSEEQLQRTRRISVERKTMKLVLTVVLFFSPLLCSPAMADGVGNFCPPLITNGTCVIDNPVYTNVFWDTSAAQWNIDNGNAGETQLVLDAILQALVNSAYFSQLAQYKVYSARMAPGITPNCGPAPATMDAFDNDTVANNFMACLLAEFPAFNNGNTVLNIFLPSTTGGGNWCANRSANHHMYGSPGVAVTILPTNSNCNGSFARLLEVMSHEMVEAATDPNPDSPTGYRDKDIGSGGNEIADLCSPISGSAVFPFLGVGPSFAGATIQGGVTNGQGTGLTQYWSDNANNCVIPFDMTPPTINTNPQVCGWGKNTHITLSGILGPRPWDLISNQFNGQTLYVQASIAHGNNTWSAGNTVLGGDIVGFGSVNWTPGTPDTITIVGFNSNYGSNNWVVGFGDSINVTVFSPINGQPSSVAVNSPTPAEIVFDTVNLHPIAGSTSHILGQVLDSSNCVVGGVTVALSANKGSLGASGTILTDDSGSFATTFTDPVAGPVTLTANSLFVHAGSQPAELSFKVYPSLTSLSSNSGPVTGGQTLTIKGFGFDVLSDTTVSASYYGNTTSKKGSPTPPGGPVAQSTGSPFGTPLTITGVAANHESVTVIMPPSPFFGDGTGIVSISATVNGVESNALPYQYGSGTGMIMPYVPVPPYSFVSGLACAGCRNSANTGFWVSGDAKAAENTVIISGRAANKLQETYTVGTISAANFFQLFGETASFEMRGESTEKGQFIGTPIQILLTGQPGVLAPITDSAMVEFAVPQSRGEELQIVHIEQAGERLKWIAVKGTTVSETGMIQAPVTESGVYAVASVKKR
jgi:hypothetical protein